MKKGWLFILIFMAGFINTLFSQSLLDLFYDELPSTYKESAKLRETENKILIRGYKTDPLLIFYYLEYIHFYHKKIMYSEGRAFRRMFFYCLNKKIEQKNAWLDSLGLLIEKDSSISDELRTNLLYQIRKRKQKKVKGEWERETVPLDSNKQFYYAYKAVKLDKQMKFNPELNYRDMYAKWIIEKKKHFFLLVNQKNLSKNQKKLLFEQIFENWYLIKDEPLSKIKSITIRFGSVPENNSILTLFNKRLNFIPGNKVNLYFSFNRTIATHKNSDYIEISSPREDIDYLFMSPLNIDQHMNYFQGGFKFAFLKIFTFDYYINFSVYYAAFDLQIPIEMPNFFSNIGTPIYGTLVQNKTHWDKYEVLGYLLSLPVMRYKKRLTLEIGWGYQNSVSEGKIEYQYHLAPLNENMVVNDNWSIRHNKSYFYYNAEIMLNKYIFISLNNATNNISWRLGITRIIL